jgi:2-methylisocitrate lyase-like PEP mutase family enzyme
MTTALRAKAELLRLLHAGPRLLVLANAWDVGSARVLAATGLSAIATSSAGVAYALGYPDGERISRVEMLDMVRRIAAAVELPVTADVEAGYGTTPEAAAQTATDVLASGAVGMNLEDASGGRLLPLELQVERVAAVRRATDAAGVPLVLNARTDAAALGEQPPEERLAAAVQRANAYLAAGADCAFVPFVSDREAIAYVARGVRGALNVLGTPASPPLEELARLGVRRVSFGSGLARAAYGRARRIARELASAGTYTALAEDAIAYAELQRLFGAAG